MSPKKKAKFKLPISPKALLDTIGYAEKQSEQPVNVAVFVDISLGHKMMSYAKEAFRPDHTSVSITVLPYFDEPLHFELQSDLVIIFANEAPNTGRILNLAYREQVQAVVATLRPNLVQEIARENYNEIDLRSIIRPLKLTLRGKELYAHMFDELGGWIVRHMGDSKTSLARAFKFVREHFVRDVIMATSLQNAAIAAVFFLPGADMPLLTLNQAKMFLKIAAAYGAELDNERLKELAVLLASGFGLRAVSRKLVGLVPMFGWAMRGSVGYGGTYALGNAAKVYFEGEGDFAKIAENLKTDAQQVVKKRGRLQN